MMKRITLAVVGYMCLSMLCAATLPTPKNEFASYSAFCRDVQYFRAAGSTSGEVAVPIAFLIEDNLIDGGIAAQENMDGTWSVNLPLLARAAFYEFRYANMDNMLPARTIIAYPFLQRRSFNSAKIINSQECEGQP